MVTISRNTTDLAADERTALERLLGTQLAENQRIVVQVMDVDADAEVDEKGNSSRTAADYAILADLEEAEADRLTEAMVQRSPGRDIAL